MRVFLRKAYYLNIIFILLSLVNHLFSFLPDLFEGTEFSFWTGLGILAFQFSVSALLDLDRISTAIEREKNGFQGELKALQEKIPLTLFVMPMMMFFFAMAKYNLLFVSVVATAHFLFSFH